MITLDGGGTSTDVAVISDGRPSLTTEGSVGRFAVKVPMVDVVTVGTGGGSIAWVSPEGTLKVGPRSAGASPGPGLLPGRRQRADDDRRVPAARPHPRAPARRRDPARPRGRRGGLRAAGRGGRPRRRGVRGRRAGDRRLEPGERDPPGHGQARARRARLRPLRVRRLGAADGVPADRHPRAADGVRPARPRQPERVRAAGHRPADRPRADARAAPRPARRSASSAARSRGWRPTRVAALERQGHARDAAASAPPTCATSGRRSRSTCPRPTGRSTRRSSRTVEARFHDAHERSYGYCYRDDPSQVVEWVNLRVTGVGAMARPALDADRAPTATRCAGAPPRLLRRPPARHAGLRARAARPAEIEGPAVIQEFGSTLPIHPGFTARVDELGNVVVRA